MKKFNFHVKPIGLLDMLHFKKMVPRRRAILQAGSLEPITAVYGVNRLAQSLHPKQQTAVISEIIPRKDANTYVLKADKLAYFRAGQYVSVKLRIGDSTTARPYTLAASPALALDGQYQITVKKAPDGFVSEYILEHWKVGTEVTLSGPEGPFSYEPIRDEAEIVGLAGGSGITPFLSMAQAIRDGDEDFSLTLLYGSRNKDNVLFYDELAALEKACPKFKVVHVLSDPDAGAGEGFEKGFLTAELIRKYAPAGEPYSVFLCGPQQMYAFVDKELEKLGLERKFIRHEMFGEFHNPAAQPDYPAGVPETVKITVTQAGETKTVEGSSNDSVLQILEKNGIAAPARCRSGECGFCHSLLISGKIYTPPHMDYRRMADLQFGFIHPCCSFPLTDLVVDVPEAK